MLKLLSKPHRSGAPSRFRRLLWNLAATIRHWQYLQRPGPWLNSAALSILDSMRLKGRIITEFGGGASTLYFLRRGAKLVQTVEHDPAWAWHIRTGAQNLGMEDSLRLLVPQSAYRYTRFYRECEKPDIILIDGLLRPQCLDEVLNIALLDSGPKLLILDNYDCWSWSSPSAPCSLGEIADFCYALPSRLRLSYFLVSGVGRDNPYFQQTAFLFTRDFDFGFNAACSFPVSNDNYFAKEEADLAKFGQ